MKQDDELGQFAPSPAGEPLGVREMRGSLQGDGRRFAVVVSRFHGDITDRLARAAVDTLVEHGVERDEVTVLRVPGAWELPTAAAWVAEAWDPDGIIAAGCVIRGDTPHFEYVAGQAARGLAEVALETGVPVAFAVLTTETVEQATARSGPGPDNKGREAALTVLEMANLFDALDEH